ncbi:MAG: hypothetical protein JSW03_02885 [Candidatus Eiseniibacteriota bacterium]|nr:MAG: hypothetical protein JSW03_02885 [Candidatus Eisenbacteria bacterium]
MKMSLRIASVFAVLIVLTSPVFGFESETASRFIVEVEAGTAWQSKNDVQIPNNSEGSRFSLLDLQGNGSWPAFRLYLTWNINSRHGLRVLAAPLSFSETGVLTSPTAFAGGSFYAGVPTEATYRFNSWRLTYSYCFHESPRWAWWVGLTGKMRDAAINLDQGDTSTEKTDLGFVPLLHTRGWYRLAERWRLVLDVDALAGGPGRAEDASLKLYGDIDPHWSVSIGYRTLEGGADVDEVYNFAWLHYAVASVSYSF